MERRWHTIYKLYNAKGRLLYVGISANALARFADHRNKPWWRQVIRAELEHIKGRSAAEARELELIQGCNPKHNIRGLVRQEPIPVVVPVHELWTDEQKVARILRAVRVRRSTIPQLAERTEIPQDQIASLLSMLHGAGRVRPWGSRGHWDHLQ